MKIAAGLPRAPSPHCSLCINGVWPTNRRTAAYHSHMLAAATFSFVLSKTSPFSETNIVKGRVALPNQMNFWPSTPPPLILGKL